MSGYSSTMSIRTAPSKRQGTISGYMCFANDVAYAVQDEYPHLDFEEIGKILASRWMNLSEAQRAPYEAQALGIRSRHHDDRQAQSAASIKPEEFTKPFCEFLTENPTIFHSVDYFKKKLENVGYKEVSRGPSY